MVKKLNAKKRIIAALAIILLVTIPLAISDVGIASTSSPVISAVLSGSSSTSSITVGPNPNPLNTTFKIDVRIDSSPAIWGWGITNINWNSTVIALIKVAEGPFLKDNTGGDSTSFVGNSQSLINNTSGQIQGGFADGILAADTSTDSSGVLATLTFNVTNYGVSPITISQGYMIATADLGSPHINITCNSATVTVLNTGTSPTPTPSPTPPPKSNLSIATLQVFTNKGGINAGFGGTYGPRDLLQTYALVISQNVSVANQDVSFSLQNPNGTMIAIGNGLTNQTGIATVRYRLPAPDPNATEITFGTWNITASLNLSQSTLTNATSFTFNYLSNIESIKMPATVNIGQALPIELTVDNGLFSAPSSELDITIFDQANVPIGSFTYINSQQMQNFTVIDITISIPQYAFPGQASACMCLLTAKGTALAPETVVHFQISP